MVTHFNVPLYLRGAAPVLETSLTAYQNALDAVDFSGIASLASFDTMDHDELERMFAFFRITPLFTRILSVERLRAMAKRGDEFNNYRGTEYVLSLFSRLSGVDYSWTFRRNSDNRPVGITFRIAPPTGVAIQSNWTLYMRDAFRFLLPARLILDDFLVSLIGRGASYVRTTAVLSQEIV